jgi:uncharacterized Tic20 family protein
MSFQESVPVSPSPTPVGTSDKALMIVSHLSIFFAPFLAPFIVWLIKRGEPDPVAAHAAEALNFHLSWLLYSLCSLALIPLFGLGVALLSLLGLASIILAIVAAIRASENVLYHYPLTIRLVK